MASTSSTGIKRNESKNSKLYELSKNQIVGMITVLIGSLLIAQLIQLFGPVQTKVIYPVDATNIDLTNPDTLCKFDSDNPKDYKQYDPPIKYCFGHIFRFHYR